MIDYREVLATQLAETIEVLGLNEYSIVIDEEIAFFTHEQILEDKTIYCVIKELSGTNVLGTFVVPAELHIFTEENSVEIAKEIFDYYAKNYNQTTYTSGFDYLQEFLGTPEITSDFYEAGAGYRGIIELDATFLIYQNVCDIESVEIDGVSEDVIQTTFSYVGNADTKSFADERLQRTVISNGTKGIQIITPAKFTSLFQKAMSIHNGDLSVNSDFNIKITFRNNFYIQGTYKLLNVDFSKKYGDLPAIQYEFAK